MLSLRDKLKAVSAQQPPREKKAPADCMIRESRTPLTAFSLPPLIPGEALGFMQGGAYPDCRREDICFLDTETTGLSHGAGTVAFLVGVGYFTEDCFLVRQYLMRDYDEEPLLLQHVAEETRVRPVLCTFNGASFDLPLLEGRFTMHRMREGCPRGPHVDLLPAARRVWKLRLKKCNLTSLEEAVLGLTRPDDLPGALAPERFFRFLKTGDEALLMDVLRHNAQDIVSLAHILDRLLRLHEAPLLAGAPEDVFSLGRVYEKRGKTEGARMCYRAADQGSLSLLARGRMAESFRRDGDFEAAARVYARMAREKQGGAGPLIALAKICEHRTRDYAAAIEYTRRAIILAADAPDGDMAALRRRYQRLMDKAGKKEDRHGLHGGVQGAQGAAPASEGPGERGPGGV